MTALVPIAGTYSAVLLRRPQAAAARASAAGAGDARVDPPLGPWGIPVHPEPLDAIAAYRGDPIGGPPPLLLDVYA